MADATFHCSIVTPTEAVFEGEVSYASIPGWDGQRGVMPGQSPVLTKLGVGSLRLDVPGGGSAWYFIDGGFAQVRSGLLTLLTERAVPADKIDAREAEADLAEANARVTQPGEDQKKIQHDQQAAIAKKTLAQAAR